MGPMRWKRGPPAGLPIRTRGFSTALDRIIRRATDRDSESRIRTVADLIFEVKAALGLVIPEKRAERLRHAHARMGSALLVVAMVCAAIIALHPHLQAPETRTFPWRVNRAIRAKDGSTMFLVMDPAGEGGPTPFYMYETPVTNIQFIRYLNHQPRHRVRVRDNRIFGMTRSGST